MFDQERARCLFSCGTPFHRRSATKKTISQAFSAGLRVQRMFNSARLEKQEKESTGRVSNNTSTETLQAGGSCCTHVCASTTKQRSCVHCQPSFCSHSQPVSGPNSANVGKARWEEEKKNKRRRKGGGEEERRTRRTRRHANAIEHTETRKIFLSVCGVRLSAVSATHHLRENCETKYKSENEKSKETTAPAGGAQRRSISVLDLHPFPFQDTSPILLISPPKSTTLFNPE